MQKFLRKFFLVFKNYILASFEYRGEMLSSWMLALLELGLSIFLWSAVIRSSGTIGGYDLPGIVVYFTLTRILNPLKTDKIARSLEEFVQGGRLSGPLLRPFSPVAMLVARALAKVVIESSVAFFVFLIPFFLYPAMFSVIHLSFEGCFAFLLIILLAFIFDSAFYFTIGCFSFWVTKTGGLRSAIGQLVNVLRGAWFPMTLAPAWFQWLSASLPFSYLAYYPSRLITNEFNLAEFYKGVLVLLISILILAAISSILWKRGLSRYSGVGI